eukprot:scaffold192_cov114-Cylindrotheca_fusiformis.AAC.7
MSKSTSHPSDWSSNGSNTGISHLDSSSGGDSPQPIEYVAPDVAKREQKAVNRSKFLVGFALLLSVSGAATATCLLMKEEDQNDFEASFASLGSEVATVTRQKVDQIFSGLDAFSLFIASEAKSDSNSSWPFVYISDFSAKSERIAALFGLEQPELNIAPLVQEQDKEKWTSYVLQTAPVWYQETIDNEGHNATIEDYMGATAPYVHSSHVVNNKRVPLDTTTTPGPALPKWQIYPLIPANTGYLTVSLDFLVFPDVAGLFKISSSTHGPAIGFLRLPDATGQIQVDSQIMQPITHNGNIVGMLWLRLPWREIFQNLNVDGVFGTIVVIRSNCDVPTIGDPIRTLSYAIDGSHAEFLGEFDAHDPKYEEQVVSKVLVDLNVDSEQFPEAICIPTLTLDLYPTDELAETFQTAKPTLYTTVVVAIFAFTSL